MIEDHGRIYKNKGINRGMGYEGVTNIIYIYKYINNQDDDDPEEKEDEPDATNVGQSSYIDPQDSSGEEGDVDAQKNHQVPFTLIVPNLPPIQLSNG